jgi:2-(1,2-epoxy-1,2-dihydrophenyl)acetyl-CoA isomerase
MEHVRMEQHGGVGIITIDRPERFNSLDVGTAQDLRRAGLQYARAEDVRAVVLRGVAGVFCSGADLKYVRGGDHDDDLSYLQNERGNGAGTYGDRFKQILEYLHSAISEMRRAPKPFIAAVDGVAAAGGLGVAMACDLVFASEGATFEWAYGKTGLCGAESATFLLPRLIGLRRVMELVLLNPRLDAAAALRMGLINAVYPREGFEASVLAVAQRLADGPTRAYGIAKALVNRAAGIDRLDYHLDQELESLARVADSPEFAEGLAAFFEKRSAHFDRL